MTEFRQTDGFEHVSTDVIEFLLEILWYGEELPNLRHGSWCTALFFLILCCDRTLSTALLTQARFFFLFETGCIFTVHEHEHGQQAIRTFKFEILYKSAVFFFVGFFVDNYQFTCSRKIQWNGKIHWNCAIIRLCATVQLVVLFVKYETVVCLMAIRS